MIPNVTLGYIERKQVFRRERTNFTGHTNQVCSIPTSKSQINSVWNIIKNVFFEIFPGWDKEYRDLMEAKLPYRRPIRVGGAIHYREYHNPDAKNIAVELEEARRNYDTQRVLELDHKMGDYRVVNPEDEEKILRFLNSKLPE